MPILYFTPDMSPAPVGTTIINYTSATTADDIFNTADDSAAPGAGAFSPTAPTSGSSSGQVDGPAFLALLGATNGNATAPGQTILGSNTYLLVSAGADGTYFNGSNIVLSGRQ